MYNSQITKDRIKSLCKKNKVNMDDLLSSCELGTNAIRQINDKKGMASVSLAKISDCLNCSVDYLLGRTDIINYAPAAKADDDNIGIVLGNAQRLNDDGLEELTKYSEYLLSKEEYKKSQSEKAAI